MKVSVHIITYNHEKYIAEALDSVLMQKVNFDYEIIIGEDCSTDNTRQIVHTYQEKHPDKIKVIFQESNTGGTKNDIDVYNACQGEYIAWLEGDDFWTSPYKLQKQADYLDQNQEFSCCFHPIIEFHENGSKEPRISPSVPPERELFFDALLNGPVMHTGALMARKFPLPKWYPECVFGDWEWSIFLIQQGRIGYLSEVMAKYRKHSSSWYHGSTRFSKLSKRIKLFQNLNEILNYKYNKHWIQKISLCYYELALEHKKSGSLSEARVYFLKSLVKAPFNKNIERIPRYTLFFQLFMPVLNKLNLLNSH